MQALARNRVVPGSWAAHRKCTTLASQARLGKRLGTSATSVLVPSPVIQPAAEKTPTWCEDEQYLSSLFHFPHMQASQLQEHCAGFVDIFSRFSRQELASGHAHGKALVQVAATLQDDNCVTWYPEYGCALLALHQPSATNARPQLQQASLLLVCLDTWEYQVHPTPGGALGHTSTCTGHKLMACGQVPISKLTLIHALILKYEQELQQKKAQNPNFKGLQRTPAFIKMLVTHAVIEVLGNADKAEDAQKFSAPAALPHGGFTDVGMHSGGIPRDTSWALVRETAKVVLCRSASVPREADPAQVFQHALLHLDIWLLQRQLSLVTAATANPNMVTAVMLMLRSAADRAAQLADAGLDVSTYTQQCAEAAEELRKVVRARVEGVADQMQLATDVVSEYRCPAGVLPPAAEARQDVDGLDAARKRAAHNLNSLPIPPGKDTGTVFSDTLQIISKLGDSGPAVQHKLHIVERLLFQMAASVASLQQCGKEYADKVKEGDALQQLAQQYHATVRLLLQDASTEQAAVLKSRELLVVWIAYCLLDAGACHAHPAVMGRYTVSLHWQDLQHLVPGSKLADDAALGVAAYLQHRRRMSVNPLFSLRQGCEQATFEFARAFAATEAGAYLQSLWKEEEQDARKRMEAHWAEVQRKQQLANKLRHERDVLKAELSMLQAACNAYEVAGFLERTLKLSSYEDCKRSVDRKATQVTNKETELRKAEAAPPPVIQPLPCEERNALPWLFFLHMPQMFRQLSQASFLAQQMLLPWPCKDEVVWTEILVPDKYASLTYHYNQQQTSQYLPRPSSTRIGFDSRLGFVSYEGSIPAASSIGPHHVDKFYSADDGVWWPDKVPPAMRWTGSGQASDQGWSLPGAFNPFGLKSSAPTAQYFTTQLHGSAAKELQPFVFCSGSVPADSTRSNLAIAWQDTKPSWLTKPGFLGAGRLRSYPLQQLQRICVELKDRTLPLGQPVIQQLVQQAVYQLGPLLEGPTLLWRTDWNKPAGILSTLTSELQGLADEMQQKPRDQEAVLLLGQVAGYVSDYYSPCLPTARQYAAMTAAEADGLDAQVASLLHAPGSSSSSSGAQHQGVSELRARQVQWRVMALTSFTGGMLTLEDAMAMVQLMVLIKHGSVFQEEKTVQERQLLLVARANRVMAARAAEVLQYVQQAPDAVLTPTIRRVLQRAPASLQWSQLSTNGIMQASWEAVDSSGTLYSINVLDGTVLCNGIPPDRLPSDITQHPLFIRVFGQTNFEVQHGSQPGVLQTVSPVRGRFYTFHLSSVLSGTPRLIITEEDPQHEVRLELLDLGSSGADKQQAPAWASDLPRRLREATLYSHWLCREQGVLLLRPPHFQKHASLFVIKLDDNGQEYDVRRVPPHLQSKHWTALLGHKLWGQLTESLVVAHTCHIQRVLSKFEDPQYIHVHRPMDGRLYFELPRYGFEFELKNGQLHSLNYEGYQLSNTQQLVAHLEGVMHYTLPDFCRYLVLRRTPTTEYVPNTNQADIMVLIPHGTVQRQSNVFVDVQVSDSPGAQLQVHCYEQHKRFGNLQATPIPARLQLAALYAATSTLLPEPLSQQTGAQTAMQLVRQSWVNRPLQEFELQQLQAIARLGGYLAAGLPLLVHELQASAHQLLHLYPHLLAPGAPLPPPPTLAPDLATAWEAESLRLQRTGCESSARLRMELTAGEEMRAQCTMTAAVPVPEWKYRQHYEPIDIIPLTAVDESVVHQTELDLMKLVQRTSRQSPIQWLGQGQEVPPYPLAMPEGQDVPPLVEAMHAELQESWENHHEAIAAGEPFVDPDVAKKTLLAKQVQVKQWRAAAQDYLQTHIKNVPDATGCHGAAFQLHQLSGTAPLPSLLDMVRWAEKPDLIERFNPFLSKASCSRLHAAVLLWLQLAVLEDRIQRAVALLEAGPEYMQLLVQELETHRTWDVCSYPTWLMFEVEGQLQIRPKQYTVALHLMKNPGAIVQLNMGEGKTRVILPMLALHWGDGKDVVQLNLLSKLLDEAHNHLHRHLCASVLNRKLFTLPFHRDVQITESGARAIWATLQYCKQEGGMLLVAPEHRLSLKLKWHELLAQGGEEAKDAIAALDAVFATPTIDVLDECDELLHHRFQLIYAMGTTQQLPSREQRVVVLQGLLRALSQLVTPDSLPQGVAVFEPTGHPGCFSGIRLLQGTALLESWPQLCESLADALIANPPYELSWIKRKPSIQDLIKRCVLDDTRSAVDIAGGVSYMLTEDECHHVLALRGFLACGLLLHCLQQRTGVDFGINRSPTALKRLAVPYRAAHTPSERSEFAQPDVAIAFTHISYYRDGLTKRVIRDAMLFLSSGASWLRL